MNQDPQAQVLEVLTDRVPVLTPHEQTTLRVATTYFANHHRLLRAHLSALMETAERLLFDVNGHSETLTDCVYSIAELKGQIL